jgi:large subunit ribosomal protein L24
MAAKLKIKKNDQVLVISGRDKGKRGRVIEVNTQTGRVVVEGINMIKKAVRPNRQRGIAGGIAEREASAIRSCRMDAKSAWRAKRAP